MKDKRYPLSAFNHGGNRISISTAQGNIFASTFDPAAARLIAAAPDLLAVLEFVLIDLNSNLDYETGVIIRDAIAKAKGEAA